MNSYSHPFIYAQYQMQQPQNNSAGIVKKKSTARVARLVRNRNSDADEEPKMPQTQTNLSTPNLSQMQYQPFGYQSCMCRVNSDSISFSLPPLNPRLVCDFSFEYAIDNRIVINTSSTTVIPFILNDVPFSLNGNEIDVTDQIKMGQNRLIFNTMNERQVITANVQWKKAKNVEAVVYKIMSEFPPMEVVPTSEFVNEIDPISKNQISFPGRGSTCTHAQCFDLKAFLNRAFETSHWECPLCGTYLTENDLRYDPCFFRNCGTSFLADDLYDTNVNDFF